MTTMVTWLSTCMQSAPTRVLIRSCSSHVCICRAAWRLICPPAGQLHPAHDMFDKDEEMRAAGVRHSDGDDWMSMKAARTQSLLSKDVRVSKGKAQTVPQEIATEKRKAEELEEEWVRKKVSQARASKAKAIDDKPASLSTAKSIYSNSASLSTPKSKVDAAMALLHAEQDSKVRQAIDIVHAADHAVRFASTIGLEKPAAEARFPGAAKGAGSKASPSKAKVNRSQKARTLEADVDSLAHQVLAKIAEERVEMGGGKSGRNEQLAAAAASASTAHRTEHVTDDIAMAAHKENEVRACSAGRSEEGDREVRACNAGRIEEGDREVTGWLGTLQATRQQPLPLPQHLQHEHLNPKPQTLNPRT